MISNVIYKNFVYTMIARISSTSKTANAIYYNEQKVKEGEARCLGLSNCNLPVDATSSIHQKFSIFKPYELLNESIKKPGLHIALAFHPDEKLTDATLKRIGEEYMQQLGYGDQPFLLYRHEDRAHPHIHIVSVNIDRQGKKINDSFQRQRSNTIRKDLEIRYNLVKAEEQGKGKLISRLLPEQLETYSEKQTKKAIGNVVRTAISDYNFSSINTLQEFLKQHQIQLNILQGKTPLGKIYQGVTFQLLDQERNQPLTPPIKASSFSFAPTVDRLQAAFKKGRQTISQKESFTRLKIDRIKASLPPGQRSNLSQALRQAGIQLITNNQTNFYIDHSNRLVLSEKELPPAYSYSQLKLWETKQPERPQQSPPFRAPSIPPPLSHHPSFSKSVKGNDQLGEKSIPKTNTQQSTADELFLRKRVSHYYQAIRQNGIGTAKAVYFESSLIERFPAQPLVKALMEEGIEREKASQAVLQFESYKQGQLPTIRAKEQDYFETTVTALANLTAGLPVDVSTKHSFLRLLGYDYNTVSGIIAHREKRDMQLSLSETTRQQLDTSMGPSVPMKVSLSKTERQLYLAIANQQPIDSKLSPYQVNSGHLEALLGKERLRPYWTSLNTAYSQQILDYIKPNQSLFQQLQDRGMIMTHDLQNGYQMGYYRSPVETFSPVPNRLARLLNEIPSLDLQQARMATTAAAQLVQLTKAIDLGHQSIINHYKTRYEKNPQLITTGIDPKASPQQLQHWLRSRIDSQIIEQKLLLNWNNPSESLSLSFRQIRSVNPQSLLDQLLTNQQPVFQRQFNQLQIMAIVDKTLDESNGPVSVHRLLADLYKRGYGLVQIQTATGKIERSFQQLQPVGQPLLPIPDRLKAIIDRLPGQSIQQPFLFRDGQWPAPGSPLFNLMIKLSNQIDRGQNTSQVVKQIHKTQPTLVPIQEPGKILEFLLKQSYPQSKDIKKEDTQELLKELVDKLVKAETKGGFLDFLGENLSTRSTKLRKASVGGLIPKRGKRRNR